jgi:hypothetical protein
MCNSSASEASARTAFALLKRAVENEHKLANISHITDALCKVANIEYVHLWLTTYCDTLEVNN